MPKMEYEVIGKMSRDDVDAVIQRNQPDELLMTVLSAALYSDDPEWAESICLRLAGHEHFNVRGNAIVGFGHIARVHGKLNADRIKSIIEAALSDGSEYVRGQAETAADDVEHFLKWQFARPRIRER